MRLQLKEILFVILKGIPERIDMDVKGLGPFYFSGIAPHIVLVRDGIGRSAVAFSMYIGGNDSELQGDFVDVWDVSENTKGSAIGEVNFLVLLIAFEKA